MRDAAIASQSLALVHNSEGRKDLLRGKGGPTGGARAILVLKYCIHSRCVYDLSRLGRPNPPLVCAGWSLVTQPLALGALVLGRTPAYAHSAVLGIRCYTLGIRHET